jgi:hypothetical protein
MSLWFIPQLREGIGYMKLRGMLRRLSSQFGLKGPYTHEDVIKELRQNYPDLIEENSRRLEDMALKRMLCDVDSRQVSSQDPAQGDLFEKHPGLRGSYDATLLGISERKGTRILTSILTISNAKKILAMPDRPKVNISPKERLRQLMKELSPFILSDADTIGDVLRRSRE